MMSSQLESLNSIDLQKLSSLLNAKRAKLLEIQERRENRRKLEAYKPYGKQKAFHAAGKAHRERLLMAANQVGKTYSGGAEMSMHLTGLYPDWWTGRRWNRPVKAWAGCDTGDTTRDGVQRILFGTPSDADDWGCGAIPYDHIDFDQLAMKRGLANAIDTAIVRHVSGGHSRIGFKTYEQGRRKWQGETLDIVWFDEEPPATIYQEGLTRTNATNGMAYLTFTPLQGMSSVVLSFLTDKNLSTDTDYDWVSGMAVDDEPEGLSSFEFG